MAVSSPKGWERFRRATPETLWPASAKRTPAVDVAQPSRRVGWELVRRPPGISQPFLRGATLGASPSVAGARSLLEAVGFGPPRAFDPRSLRTAADLRSRVGRTIVLQQHLDGRDVHEGSVKVTFTKTGSFIVSGQPLADPRERRPRGAPTTSAHAAKAAAAAAFDVEPRTVRGAELQSLPTASGEARWAWRTSIVVDDPPEGEPLADVLAYLDADTLEVVLSFNIASALTGRAMVYEKDPGRTPNLRDVALWDLGPAPLDRLAGPRLVVLTGVPPPVTHPSRDFRVGPTERGFDEANAYYQLRSALRYYSRLRGRRRVTSPPFRPVRAFVRERSARNNAYYLPDDGTLHFGDFDDGLEARSSARSADALYHELGHAISDYAAKLGRAPGDSQARGLSEGYSDYFACSALADARMFEWLAPGEVRDCADPQIGFAASFAGPEHVTGNAWAAVLWGLRQRSGATDADKIAFESLFMLSPSSTFTDAKEALLAANDALSGLGKVEDRHQAIEDAWVARV